MFLQADVWYPFFFGVVEKKQKKGPPQAPPPHISGDQSSRKVHWNPLTRKAYQTQDIQHSTLESWVRQPGTYHSTI